MEKIETFKQRISWHFNWVSSGNNDFNLDFNVSFTPEEVAPGTAFYNYTRGPVPIDELSSFSIFYKAQDGTIYHTYSTFGRGAEYLMSTYVVLDITPKGRNENGPHYNLTDWVRHHDRYDAGGHVASTGKYVPAPGTPCCSSDKEGRT